MSIHLIYPLAHDRTGADKPRLTQAFGARPDYYAQFNLPGHEGVDYGAYLGQPIWAAARGRVMQVKPAENPYHVYGIHCWVDHGSGYWTAYCHLSRLDVALNQLVQAGDKIGQAGKTGNSDGVHLHFNLTFKNAAGVVTHLNPALYFGEIETAPESIPDNAHVRFTVTHPKGLNVRRDADINSTRISTLATGTQLWGTQQMREKGGYRWLEVAGPQTYKGVNIGGGWVAIDYSERVTYGVVSLPEEA